MSVSADRSSWLRSSAFAKWKSSSETRSRRPSASAIVKIAVAYPRIRSRDVAQLLRSRLPAVAMNRSTSCRCASGFGQLLLEHAPRRLEREVRDRPLQLARTRGRAPAPASCAGLLDDLPGLLLGLLDAVAADVLGRFGRLADDAVGLDRARPRCCRSYSSRFCSASSRACSARSSSERIACSRAASPLRSAGNATFAQRRTNRTKNAIAPEISSSISGRTTRVASLRLGFRRVLLRQQQQFVADVHRTPPSR